MTERTYIMTDLIDLSGVWRLALKKPDAESSDKIPEYDDEITLPSTTSYSGKGEDNCKRETGFLTDTKLFEGSAWFSKRIDLTSAAGRTAKLYLERTRMTKVYIDGVFIGENDSLTAPHIYDITGKVSAGEHEITVCVTNVGYPTAGGHLTSQDTQTNWNGITGELSVRIYGESHAEDVRAFPSLKNNSFRIKGRISGKLPCSVRVCAESLNFSDGEAHRPEPMEFFCENEYFDIEYLLGEGARKWSEFSPEYYKLSLKINDDVTEVTAGLRELTAHDGKFFINGRKTFLRGKHDGMIFPKTGFAPTDVSEWVRALSISKSYGINHYRFHTCCPPEAAFEAADIVGIYMQPELPFWGTIQSPDEEGFNEAEQNYLIAEGFKMLLHFGNHPSFCMMSLGNELWGSPERLNAILGEYKRFDPCKLYTQGSNNFQWFPNTVENDDFFVGVRLSNGRLIRGSYAMCDAPLGFVQTDKPNTLHSYDGVIHPERLESEERESGDTVQIQYGTTMKTVKAAQAQTDFIPDIPIITHEIGQYETYPDFDEIKKYTGSVKARNFEIFRERLEKKGLLHLAKDYFRASGALSVSCYKAELEAALSSEDLGGFQILDIQDFSGQGTALVGVLDAFMDEKGICSPKEWREFCSDAVIMAKFDDYCLTCGEKFTAGLLLTAFREKSFIGKKFFCELSSGGKVIERTDAVINDDSNYCRLGNFTAELPDTDKPITLSLSLGIEDEDVRNHYKLYLYPAPKKIGGCEKYIFSSADDAQELLRKGGTALIVPDPVPTENTIEGFYCQDFWCYPMFSSISKMMGKPEPVGTMGLLIDKNHPSLSLFPCEEYSEPIWWEIVSNSRSEILDGRPDGRHVIIRTIDNFERNHDLALMYEYSCGGGTAVVLNCNIKNLKSSEGKQFVYSVLKYIKEQNENE